MNDQTKDLAPVTIDTAPLAPFASITGFEVAQRVAKALMTSTMVPEHYQHNMGNCLIAMELSARTNSSILSIMQNVYIVYGRPAWSGQYCVAALNVAGRYAEPIDYEFKGTQGSDDWGCRVVAITNSGKTIYGPWVDIAMAKAEGWYQKKGSKWQTMPELMLRYRAASFFAKTETPELLMGMQTVEELRDIGQPETQPNGVTVEDLMAKQEMDDDEGIIAPLPKAKDGKPVSEVQVYEDTSQVITSDPEKINIPAPEPKPLITPTWPKQRNDGVWVDKSGVEYNKKIHAGYSGPWPTVNSDGKFRAKRGKASKSTLEKALERAEQHRPGQTDASDTASESDPVESSAERRDDNPASPEPDDRQEVEVVVCNMANPWDGKTKDGQHVLHENTQEWKRGYDKNLKQVITMRCISCGETWEERPE